KIKHALAFVFEFDFAVGPAIAIGRFIPHVPGQNAGVIGKRPDHTFYVSSEPSFLRGIAQCFGAGALYPSGIVHARNRRMLWSEFRIWIPTGIEQHKNRADVVLRRDAQEGINSLLKAPGVLLPEEIVQK